MSKRKPCVFEPAECVESKHTTRVKHFKKPPFGSAKNRTKTQQQSAHEHFNSVLQSNSAKTCRAVCFTDGACKQNPGPGGSACIIYLLTDKLLQLTHVDDLPKMPTCTKKKYLGRLATNNIAELSAAHLAIQELLELSTTTVIEVADIFTDSKYTQGMLEHNWNATKNKELVHTIRQDLIQLKNKMQVNIHWVAGHADIAPNELVDKLANAALLL